MQITLLVQFVSEPGVVILLVTLIEDQFKASLVGVARPRPLCQHNRHRRFLAVWLMEMLHRPVTVPPLATLCRLRFGTWCFIGLMTSALLPPRTIRVSSRRVLLASAASRIPSILCSRSATCLNAPKMTAPKSSPSGSGKMPVVPFSFTF